MATPRSAAMPANRRQVSGWIVEWMATIPPGDMPASTPSARRRTSSTSASATTQTPTTSLAAPRSAGVDATVASVSRNDSNEGDRRAQIVRGKPSSAMRRAIGAP